ncbi:D-aminoacyl-tRNA deacylase [Tritonibacter horizontis]|uniref:D-aminoacyl-tRNA deacylase n=1 Tax=Tritonibacter horizontis TaxID=1768241 RepID=A0A132C200_9RHOB|nr:D-aminoacyl-tRNA deacylase [Tritonibacter horizontis]KUP94292.1 D-tyrosyl-tRNA(Tyr) deacylase [Tritonibacter horizontis]
MRALIQRVSEASVHVDSVPIGEIGPGLLVLVCAMTGDSETQVDQLVHKISRLRIFCDDAGKMNRSVTDTGGAVLVVSQFTLAADTRSGTRPSFSKAAPPTEGERLYHCFCEKIRACGLPLATGAFGADMKVSLVNDGPVTIWLDTETTPRKIT